MNDSPIHLQNYCVCKVGPHTEPSVTVPVWITQSNLDGLCALLKFHEGMRAGGHGEVSGAFELMSFYRTLRSSIIDAHNKAREEANAGARETDRPAVGIAADNGP